MKKRLISLSLAVLLLAGLALTSPEARAAETEIEIVSVEGKVVTAAAPAGIAHTLYCAAYDLSGRMLAVQEAADPAAARFDFSGLPLVARYKLFCLDRDTMAPLTAAAEVSGLGTEGETQELLYALSLGFSLDKIDQDTMTAAEMMKLLDKLVETAAPDKLTAWQQLYPALRNGERALNRAGVVGALYLALDCIGGDYLDNKADIDNVKAVCNDTLPIFTEGDNLDQALFADAPTYDMGDYGQNRSCEILGRAYAILHRSPVDGEHILHFQRQIDPENSGNDSFTFGMAQPATWREGLMAVVRTLVCHNLDQFEPAGEGMVYWDAAQARKTAILNTPSDYTVGVGGKVYYVSPDGDDANSGLSPDTPWKTLDKVNSASAQVNLPGGLEGVREQNAGPAPRFPEYQWAADHPDQCVRLNAGDVVLFQRGGIWRGLLQTVSGVTYSAYGHGPKPEIWGSPENGSGAEKWSLMDGTDNIWVYHRDLQDCGGILLGERTVATKYAPFWDKDSGKWLDFGEEVRLPAVQAQTRPEFTAEQLTQVEDLRFFNALEHVDADLPTWCTGKLYLRCDGGNPGVLYDSIEFFTGTNAWLRGVYVDEDAVLDNLTFRYLSTGVVMGSGATVRNCAVDYVGGIVQAYGKEDNDATAQGNWSVIRCGDGIQSANGTLVENNYVTHCFDFGISVEGYPRWEFEDISQFYRHHAAVQNNVLEDNTQGLLMAAWAIYYGGVEESPFDGVTFSGNYVLNGAVDAWAHASELAQEMNLLAGGLDIALDKGTKNIRVEHNVFWRSHPNIAQVVLDYDPEGDNRNQVVFSGNVLVQDIPGFLARVGRRAMDSRWVNFYNEGELATLLGANDTVVIPTGYVWRGQ